MQLIQTHSNRLAAQGFVPLRAGSIAGEAFTDLHINRALKKDRKDDCHHRQRTKVNSQATNCLWCRENLQGTASVSQFLPWDTLALLSSFPLEAHYSKQLSYFYANSCFTGDKTAVINSSHFLPLDEKKLNSIKNQNCNITVSFLRGGVKYIPLLAGAEHHLFL